MRKPGFGSPVRPNSESKINTKSNAKIEAEQMRANDENNLKIDATTVGFFSVFLIRNESLHLLVNLQNTSFRSGNAIVLTKPAN